MRLSLVGLSHRVAPVELRERVALEPARAAALARDLGDAVCLSTCYRTELYLADGSLDRAVSSLEEIADEPLDSVVYRLHDEAAAVHLFRVAAGLDSLVPGEGEILGQVRSAYDAASPGPLLDRVFRQALQIGKRVRTETAIGENPASVPAAAAALAQQVFGDLRGRRVLLVGAGRMGELAAANLSSRGATIAYVANRSNDPALALAGRFGAEPIGLDDVPGFSVTSTSCSPRRARPERSSRRPTSRPAGISPCSSSTSPFRATSTRPCTSSTAATSTTSTISRRSWPRPCLGAVRPRRRPRRLVAEEAERFREWQASLEVVPAITSLRAHAEEIRAAELAKLGRLSEHERRTVESVTAQILNKLLHLPTVRMKEAAAADEGAAYADAVRHLFGLEEER